MIPVTLSAVASLVLQGDSFDRCLANFLDGFYASPRGEALIDRPALLSPALSDLGRIEDAYLAACAEELARQFKLPLPTWTRDPERALNRPWFASPMAALRAVLLLESPAGFRSRNLFVSANALSRA